MDETVWHKTFILIPRISRSGWPVVGEVWRRKTSKGWEYDGVEETPEEWMDRQW